MSKLSIAIAVAALLGACAEGRIASGPVGTYDSEGARSGHFGAGLHAGRVAGR